MVSEFETPFGRISMLLDGREIEFDCEQHAPHPKWFPDVDGVYRLSVTVKHDWRSHELVLQLMPAGPCKTDNDSGERLECIAIYIGTGKISMGCYDPIDDGRDYDAYHGEEPHLIVDIFPTTQTELFEFGVCWINNVTDDNEIQTSEGADIWHWKYLDSEDES